MKKMFNTNNISFVTCSFLTGGLITILLQNLNVIPPTLGCDSIEESATYINRIFSFTPVTYILTTLIIALLAGLFLNFSITIKNKKKTSRILLWLSYLFILMMGGSVIVFWESQDLFVSSDNFIFSFSQMTYMIIICALGLLSWVSKPTKQL
jgi:uncharacterized membrane protein YbjE (DUF340 family)